MRKSAQKTQILTRINLFDALRWFDYAHHRLLRAGTDFAVEKGQVFTH
jgi:hypothetical protein